MNEADLFSTDMVKDMSIRDIVFIDTPSGVRCMNRRVFNTIKGNFYEVRNGRCQGEELHRLMGPYGPMIYVNNAHILEIMRTKLPAYRLVEVRADTEIAEQSLNGTINPSPHSIYQLVPISFEEIQKRA